MSPAPPPNKPRRGTQRASHLRQVNNGSSEPKESRPATGTASENGIVQPEPTLHPLPMERKCFIWVHDESFSKEEVVMNLDLFPDVKVGDLMAILPLKTDTGVRDFQEKAQHSKKDGEIYAVAMERERSSSQARSPGPRTKHDDSGNRCLFIVRNMPLDMKTKQPTLEISISKTIADSFCLRHRSNVLLTTADPTSSTATHVEMSFKDEYLTRSDMWRLTVAELSNKIVFKGQKILFMGTIKAQVTCVYISGRKVQSAFFSTSTKPIFRSESARYVLFIQMSREMWDFDSEGSGEIMFNKVVNGFLPALFKKWVSLKAKHLVSIVLFTRVEYDTGITSEFAASSHDNAYHTGIQSDGNKRPYKDFYRVVVSEMASGSWTTILYQLKREFKFFRRDISMHRIDTLGLPEATPLDGNMRGVLGTRIEAQPSLAMHGNVLEAINLASSQFSHDYIDRDLMRTGISIVVITPCPGLFEVDYETLRMTTECLIGNGIGIDLVCLPKMPLHSVPLFRYRNPQYAAFQETLHYKSFRSEDSTPRQNAPIFGSSFSSVNGSLSPTKLSQPERAHRSSSIANIIPPNEWSYAIPHWVDVSFWTGASQDIYLTNPSAKSVRKYLKRRAAQRANEFEIRCKMYEMEMASVMETAGAEIVVKPIQQDALFPQFAIGPKDVPGKQQTRERVHNCIKRDRKHMSHAQIVIGPSKSAYDRHWTAEEKRLVSALDHFDLTRSEVLNNILNVKQSQQIKKHFKTGSEEAAKKLLTDDHRIFGTSFGDGHDSMKELGLFSTSSSSRHGADSKALQDNGDWKKQSSVSIAAGPSIKSPSRPAKFGRQISLGKFGFGVAAPKAATAEIQTEHANADKPSTVAANTQVPKRGNAATSTHFLASAASSIHERPSSSQSERPNQNSEPAMADSKKVAAERTIDKTLVRPMTVRSALQSLDSTNQFKSRSVLGSLYESSDRSDVESARLPQSLKSDDNQRLFNSKLLAGSVPELPATLSPTTALSPWLTVLNPSNPKANDIFGPSQYRRWQHVFPKPISTKTMKWKSLCSPASVPLTTDFFPTKEQLDTEYQQKPYNISQNSEDDFNETPKTREEFLRELIALRLSQGFQIVVGPLVATAFGQRAMKIANVFERDRIAEDGASVFMSMGNTIHQLSCVNETEIEVNMFVRRPTTISTTGTSSISGVYNPAIRTTLAFDYKSRPIILGRPREEYNWNYVDAFIAGFDEEMSENLRFWRARFVLIPVERPTQLQRRQGEDNEEEIRLEGIKKLTQIWQRHRVITTSEKRFQNPTAKKMKDPNPLDIVYKTEDPSIVVSAELETLPLVETAGGIPRRGQLLETDRFRKSKLDIAALAEAIQSPVERGGVRMQNRKWHWRFHYNCFIGSDMTTWLIENFEDIETREEAVEFGNLLMAKDEQSSRVRDKEIVKDNGKDRDRDMGIFVHCEKRHPFRDGQFFYQVTGEFAKQRPESRSGWFGSRRRDNSVPSTPLTESMMRDSPRPEQSRSGSNHDEVSSDSGATTPTTNLAPGKRPKVALSKVMKYDVDHRKRSYRPERINLHYDRLHNPDNCYHIRIDWMGVTAKLIEDAIESWANTAERYGLRLVEAPIGEASTITSIHPFRSPYTITLAAQPPDQQPKIYFDVSSFTPQAQTTLASRHYYQKAIMKKFNFVLDIEAARNFPSNVDVSYSWGRPDFKYSQYIHRSGVLLAQITDDGDFLLLANRLFNNRTMAARESDRYVKTDHTDRSIRMVSSVYGERPTPLNSPMLRPVTSFTTFGSPVMRATSDVLAPSLVGANLKPPFTANVVTPESIKNELESFCKDVKALEVFYKEILERSTPPSATPPILRSPYAGGLLDSIETLGLPPGILARDTSPGPMRLTGSGTGSGPTSLQQFGRRASVQIGMGEGSRQQSPRSSIAEGEKEKGL